MSNHYLDRCPCGCPPTMLCSCTSHEREEAQRKVDIAEERNASRREQRAERNRNKLVKEKDDQIEKLICAIRLLDGQCKCRCRNDVDGLIITCDLCNARALVHEIRKGKA